MRLARPAAQFTKPTVMSLLLSICIADAVYMLSLYQVTRAPSLSFTRMKRVALE